MFASYTPAPQEDFEGWTNTWLNTLPWFRKPSSEEYSGEGNGGYLDMLLPPLIQQLGISNASGNAQQQQMDQVRPTYESNSLADLYKQPEYTQQAWNPYGYDYAPPDYNADDVYGFGQTSMNQNTYGMG